uniref:Secreted RxLR effector protein 153 n=1 Tax=Plasmopara viticola TaxID=143451 RepID=RL153_PLAVT|nr:RecName: Full=Secreted RxLR effector protein 153; Flags: Precursor [Plasmopara viticola]
MRNRAFLFGLFFIEYACLVLFAAPTRASLLKSNVESTLAEQWDSNGTRTLQADDSKRISAEERSMEQALLPGAEAMGKTKVPEKAVPRASLGSKLNPLNWPKRIWYKLRLWYARVRLYILKQKTTGENAIGIAAMEGLTPLSLKKLKNEIFHYSSSEPHDKWLIEKDYNSFVKHYFSQFYGLYQNPPVSEIDKWNILVEEMLPLERIAVRMAMDRVGRIVDKGYSIEKLISLDVSPLLYLRLMDSKGVFENVKENKDAIEHLRDYVEAYHKNVMM